MILTLFFGLKFHWKAGTDKGSLLNSLLGQFSVDIFWKRSLFIMINPGPCLFVFFFLKSDFFFSSFFLAEPRGLRDLRSGPGIEPVPSTEKAPSPNHWTAREFTKSDFLNGDFM